MPTLRAASSPSALCNVGKWVEPWGGGGCGCGRGGCVVHASRAGAAGRPPSSSTSHSHSPTLYRPPNPTPPPHTRTPRTQGRRPSPEPTQQAALPFFVRLTHAHRDDDASPPACGVARVGARCPRTHARPQTHAPKECQGAPAGPPGGRHPPPQCAGHDDRGTFVVLDGEVGGVGKAQETDDLPPPFPFLFFSHTYRAGWPRPWGTWRCTPLTPSRQCSRLRPRYVMK